MRFILFFMFFLYTYNSYCQKKDIALNLRSTFDRNSSLWTYKTTWSLINTYSDSRYASKRSDQIERDIDSIVNGEKSVVTSGLSYINLYSNKLKCFFINTLILGKDVIPSYLYSNLEIPVSFTYSKDTSLVLMIEGLNIETTYNTLKLTSKQRAQKVINSYLFDMFNSYKKCYFDNDIKYFGINCVYGSKDFSNKGTRSMEPESLTLIVPVVSMYKFLDGEITDNDLLEESDIFLSDRDNSTSFKKIRLMIE